MPAFRIAVPLALVAVAAGLLAPGLARADETDLEKRLAEVEDRLDRVEKKTILDRINWGAEYRTILNTFVYRGPTSNAYDLTDPANPLSRRQISSTSEEVWSHRLRLSLRAEPISSLRFTGRLVMYKLFGNSNGPAFVQDSMQSRVPRDSAVRFDQLWIDWFIQSWLALSVGRIAYSEGNPNELRNNSDLRQATWGLQMVDGEYETANLTVNLSKLLDGLYIRGFYASWYNPNTDDAFGGFPFLSSGTSNLRIFGGNADLTIPRLGKNFVQLGYFIVPRFRPFQVPIPDPGFNPAADYTHAPVPLNGSLLFPSKMPDSMGDYQNISLLVEFYDFLRSGLDWFAAASVGLLHPNGKGIEYDLPYPGGARQSTPFLFLTGQGEGDYVKTFFLYAGLRYTAPLHRHFKPKLGFEFNYASRFHISFATPTDQLLTKLATRGQAYETYLILPVNKHLYLRATYLYVLNNYYGGFFGPNPALAGSTAPDWQQRTHNVQLIMNAAF